MKKKDFKCQNCGECCRHYVLLSKSEVKRIEKLGFKDFTEEDHFGKPKQVIKLDEGKCFFLRFKGNSSFCIIYQNRPKICRVYPFFKKEIKDCKPKILFPN